MIGCYHLLFHVFGPVALPYGGSRTEGPAMELEETQYINIPSHPKFCTIITITSILFHQHINFPFHLGPNLVPSPPPLSLYFTNNTDNHEGLCYSRFSFPLCHSGNSAYYAPMVLDECFNIDPVLCPSTT